MSLDDNGCGMGITNLLCSMYYKGRRIVSLLMLAQILRALSRRSILLLLIIAVSTQIAFGQNYSLSFDGVDDYIKVPYDQSLYPTSITVSLWMNKSSPIPSIYKYVLSTSGSGATPPYDPLGILFPADSQNVWIGFQGNNDSAIVGLHSETLLDTNSWYNIYASFDENSGNAALFLNGIKEDSATTIMTLDENNLGMIIGSGQTPSGGPMDSHYFHGTIDEVCIWNRALTQEEIQLKIYEDLDPDQETGLVGYWKFNEGSGTTAYDLSVNGNHGTISGATWSTGVLWLPIVSTDLATNITTSSALLNGVVNPNNLSTTVTFEYFDTTGYGNTVPATESPLSGWDDVSVSATITDLSPNATYHYLVVAVNDSGTTTGANRSFTTLPTYPSSFTLNTSISFPTRANASDYSATDYRIVGLPGASNLSVESLLSGNQNEDWQIYWDNGASSDYLVEYDGSSTFRFSTGRAFWLIHKGPWSVNITVPSAPLDTLDVGYYVVYIPLHSGWNLITNPFTSSLPWSIVKSMNGISHTIYSYEGSFGTSSIFDPYKGYYYFNEENLSVIVIPCLHDTLGKTAASDNQHEEGWRINISLSTGDMHEHTTWFGVTPGASRGKDRFDYRKPRAVGPVPGVYFYRTEWDPDYSMFATDIRSEFNESQTWEFSVHHTPFTSCELSFDNINEIPAEFEVYLIDEERARYADLRENPHYTFISPTQESNFIVVVGKENVIKERLTSILPKKFALGNNFPNPFNSVTTIPVDVPSPSNITLIVYDMLGREVTTLYSGAIEPGRHFFIWNSKDENGNPVSTGTYICRLNNRSGILLSTKITLLK